MKNLFLVALTGLFTLSLRTVPFSSLDYFVYESVTLGGPALFAGEDYSLSVIVTNRGRRAGEHDVVLFVGDVGTTERRVCQVKRVALASGESREVVFTIVPERIVEQSVRGGSSFIFYLGDREMELSYVED